MESMLVFRKVALRLTGLLAPAGSCNDPMPGNFTYDQPQPHPPSHCDA